jgi:hypothetical protein
MSALVGIGDMQIGGDPTDVIFIRDRIPTEDVHEDPGMMERFTAVVALEEADHLS